MTPKIPVALLATLESLIGLLVFLALLGNYFEALLAKENRLRTIFEIY